jgi:hypothetical protein
MNVEQFQIAMVATAPRQKMYEFDPMSGTTLGVVEIDIDKVSISTLTVAALKSYNIFKILFPAQNGIAFWCSFH